MFSIFKKKIWKVIGRTNTSTFEVELYFSPIYEVQCHIVFLENQFGEREVILEIDKCNGNLVFTKENTKKLTERFISSFAEEEFVSGVGVEKFNEKYKCCILEYDQAAWEYEDYAKNFHPNLHNLKER